MLRAAGWMDQFFGAASFARSLALTMPSLTHLSAPSSVGRSVFPSTYLPTLHMQVPT